MGGQARPGWCGDHRARSADFSHPSFASAQDLDAIDAELTQAGAEHEVFQRTDGRPTPEAILGAATAHEADLVVLGLRPQSRVGKLITGITAQHLLLDALPGADDHGRGRPRQLTLISRL